MCPASASFTWSTLGLLFLSNSAFAVTIQPGVQNPQSAATYMCPIRCNGCRFRSSPRPSTVNIFLPTTSVASVWQEYSGVPSTITLQAPQLPRLQLRLVPVSPSFTAMTSHNVVRASYSAEYGLPLITKDPVSFVIGVGIASGAAAAVRAPVPTVVNTTAPEPAAFRKFLREYFILVAPYRSAFLTAEISSVMFPQSESLCHEKQIGLSRKEWPIF